MERRATLHDLMGIKGKNELIDGVIVYYPPFEVRASVVKTRIMMSLWDFSKLSKCGKVFSTSLGYAVPRLSSGRESFSADLSFYIGPPSKNPMWFVEGPPTFAVEMRRWMDPKSLSDEHRVAKRRDYFEAGTLVVWDVDLLEEVIYCHRRDSNAVIVYQPDAIADAEPAVPGWSMAVEEIFRDE